MIDKAIKMKCLEPSVLDGLLDLYMCSEEKLQSYQNYTSSHQKLITFMESSLQAFSFTTQDQIDYKNQFQLFRDQEKRITRTHQQDKSYNMDCDEDLSQYINNKQQEQKENKNNSKCKDKNSNSIKKIGRIILDHLSQYTQFQQQNTSLKEMMHVLSHSKNQIIAEEYKKRDRFNTQHLRILFDPSKPKLMSFNLKKTHRLLSRCLRKVVLRSDQIKESSKLVYLNTMKCSSLRCANPKLAIRLQMSNQYK